jgi:hypothetical protein
LCLIIFSLNLLFVFDTSKINMIIGGGGGGGGVGVGWGGGLESATITWAGDYSHRRCRSGK